MKKTRAEFLAGFRVPADTAESFRFGKQSAFFGHGRLSFREFFLNDAVVRISDVSRGSLFNAYLAGHAKGKTEREKRDGRDVPFPVRSGETTTATKGER